MRAAFVTAYGRPVEVREITTPSARPGEVVVRVHAASVNPLDYKMRDGKLRMVTRGELPLVLGSDFSGVVEARGAGVDDWTIGDEVYGFVGAGVGGCFAEQLVVRAHHIARKPANLSHVEAAAIPLVGLTAWQALVDQADLQKRQKLLVLGGSGGVGSMAVQIGVARGAWVSATCSDRNVDYVCDLGADMAIDYEHASLTRLVPRRHVVFDTVGGKWLAKAFKLVREGGTVVTITAIPTADGLAAFGAPSWVQAVGTVANFVSSLRASAAECAYLVHSVRPDAAGLHNLRELAEAGRIKPHLARVLGLDDVEEALSISRSRRVRGKLVIDVAGS